MRNLYQQLLVVAAIVSLALVPADVEATLTRTGAPNVSFTALGPGGLRIVGKTADLTVQEAEGELTIRVQLAGLETGIALRDKHLKEKYLEVQKYPEAELKVARSALRVPEADGSVQGDATGTLRLHGKSKSEPFHYQVKRAGSDYQVVGALHLNVRDFDITVPSYLGVTVKPDVTVDVTFSASEAAAAPAAQ